MTHDIIASADCTPFEGPEKLLEVWFAPSPAHVQLGGSNENGSVDMYKSGLRAIPQSVWEEMLDIVKCKVLSVVSGKEIDAYLLSESSLFVFPHKLILKTCGRTLNLLGLPRILSIASSAGLHKVYQLFYSRKSFMFPEHQLEPHKDWSDEVRFLDGLFANEAVSDCSAAAGRGGAYTVGRVNGDHWLLYIIGPDSEYSSEQPSPVSLCNTPTNDGVRDCFLPSQDYTIEILMSDLSPAAREPFTYPISQSSSPLEIGAKTSVECGITDLFPSRLSRLDAYAFDPCGYSANALIDTSFASTDATRVNQDREGYYSIHVTPEEGYSYASFECNVALPADDPPGSEKKIIPSLHTLIERVVKIFQPGRLTLTVFVSASDLSEGNEIELAQKAFSDSLRNVSKALQSKPAVGSASLQQCPGSYKRIDKINYEFGGYDLAFATFEWKGERCW